MFTIFTSTGAMHRGAVISALVAGLLLVGAGGCSDRSPEPVGSPPASEPALYGLLDQTVEPDSSLVLPVAAANENGPAPILAIALQPDGSIFVDSGNGRGALVWIPSRDDLGTYPVTFYAIDPADSSRADSQVVLITVGYHSTEASTWQADSLFWRTTLDASDSADWIFFSLTRRDAVGVGSLESAPDGWDLAVCRERIVQHDSALFPGTGEVVAGSLRGRLFSEVGAGDTVFAVWRLNEPGRANMSWFRYYHPSLTASTAEALRLDVYPRVFVFTDATGEHLVKARVDSSNTRLGGFPDMGNIYLSYYYQPVAGSRALDGEVQQVVLPVSTGAAYFDFSTGSRVYPADPATSLDWDILITRVMLVQNGGVSGPGRVRSHPIFLSLSDSTDLGAVTWWDGGRPMWDDFWANAFINDYASPSRNWFVYDGVANRFEPGSQVYLIRSAGRLYKLAFERYDPVDSNVSGGTYTFIWKEL